MIQRRNGGDGVSLCGRTWKIGDRVRKNGKPKRMFFLVLVVSLWCGFLFLAPSILYFNTTSSIPAGFYVRIPATVIRKGDIVCYPPPNPVIQELQRMGATVKDDLLFIKEVGAVAGESYWIDKETGEFVAAGKRIGIARKVSSGNIPMPDHSGRHVVPEGEFLPVAPHIFSFDGRYTGTCPLSIITSRAVPLILFP